jgi:hypothetical protein
MEFVLTDNVKRGQAAARPKNFLEYAKMRAKKGFIAALVIGINRYRSSIFNIVLKNSKLHYTLSKTIKTLTKSISEAFLIIKQNSLKRSLSRLSTTEPITKLASVLKHLTNKAITVSFFKVLYFRPKNPSFRPSEQNQEKSLIECYYLNQIKTKVLTLERKMRTKQEIVKSTAYLKIIAYAKSLMKKNSPFKPKNTSPLRPNENTGKASCYTPDPYRPSREKNLKNSPIYLPLFKFMSFTSQNHYMSVVRSFKHWRLSIILQDMLT